MSLEFAILGFLNYNPQSGYDLKKTFDDSVRHFWQADQSQIYRTLSRLTERGFAEVEKIRQEDRPDRKVYHITDTGRQEFIQWLMAAPTMDGPRSAALVQIFFLGQLSDEQAVNKFESFAEMMRMMLALYDQVPSKVEKIYQTVGSERELFFWNLTLENGIRNMQANLDWAESVIERIKAGQAPTN